MKLKTGDKVKVITGADKGKTGTITQVFPLLNRVIVDGVNMHTKNLRGRGKEAPGQKVDFAAPIHASNVQLIGASGKVGRIGYKFLDKDGKKVKTRVLRHGKKTEDVA